MRSRWLGIILAGLAGVVSIWAWSRLPATVDLPWGRPGQSVVPRIQAALGAPLLILGLWGLIRIFPHVDPRGKEAYERFEDTYLLIANLLMIFATASHVVVLAAAAGGASRPDGLLVAAAGVVIAVIGNYLSRVEPNWFFGIRTPWTLASDVVWHRTHRVVGRIVFVAGLLLAAFGPLVAIRPGVIVGAAAGGVAVTAMVVSWMIWRAEGKPRDGG